MRQIVSVMGCLLAGAVAVGCGGGTTDPGPQEGVETGAASEALRAEIEGKFSAYAQALLDDDHALLASLISSEVKLRTEQMGSDIAGFASKMRTPMLTEFPTLAAERVVSDHFSVQAIHDEGTAVRVDVAFDGKVLEKPFYYVDEGGDYKLNLLRPGFTTPLPEGAGAASDKYRVRNNNVYDSSISCTGNYVNVGAGMDAYVTCTNKCGWWHGSVFFVGPEGNAKCDYNTWGVDAYIDDGDAIGFHCNDKC